MRVIEVGARVRVIDNQFDWEKSPQFVGLEGEVTNVCSRYALASVPITVRFDEPKDGMQECYFGYDELEVIS